MTAAKRNAPTSLGAMLDPLRSEDALASALGEAVLGQLTARREEHGRSLAEADARIADRNRATNTTRRAALGLPPVARAAGPRDVLAGIDEGERLRQGDPR